MTGLPRRILIHIGRFMLCPHHGWPFPHSYSKNPMQESAPYTLFQPNWDAWRVFSSVSALAAALLYAWERLLSLAYPCGATHASHAKARSSVELQFWRFNVAQVSAVLLSSLKRESDNHKVALCGHLGPGFAAQGGPGSSRIL